MKSRLLFVVKYFFLWVLISLLQKILFLIFNYHESFDLAPKDWLGILYHGIPMDLSTAGYISFFPALLIAFSFSNLKRTVSLIIHIYTYILLFIVLFLGVVDMDLYSYWGFRLDTTPLLYMKTPGDALASVSILEIAALLVLFGLLFFGFLKLYRRFFSPVSVDPDARWWKSLAIGFFLAAFMFIPVRGGFGIAPMNLGRVYFHQNSFANQSAINVSWNTIYSITKQKKLNTQYKFMEDEKADELFKEILAQDQAAPKKIIKDNSNILLIILESFSNKVIAGMGGEEGLAPNLSELTRSAVVFTNFYANGNRSDKAMGSIFAGFPTLPTVSILNFPQKVQSMPFIYERFAERGYETAFYYGGDINFANFRAFFSGESVDRLVTDSDFSTDLLIQKWGVPDGQVLEKLQEDLENREGPFFYSLFTLSSHEPWDVPMDPIYGESNREELCRNGYHYTDMVLGKFLAEARNSSWWDNTLVVIMADHGSRSPGNTSRHSKKNFNIPMIWTGGAVLKDSVITKIGSQVDFAATLLSQYDIDFSNYIFSKDLLDINSPEFAFYAFNNGFSFIQEDSRLIYDLGFKKVIEREGEERSENLEKGMAFLQKISDYFNAKQ